VISGIIASEMCAGFDEDGSKEEWVKALWIIGNISTIPLSNIFYFI
jgi:hypothetical protein